MNKGLFLLLIMLITTSIANSQEAKPLTLTEIIIEQTAIPDEFIDPEFLALRNKGISMFDYNARTPELEEYIKNHPAFPVLAIKNPTADQMQMYMMMLEKWMAEYGSYYPYFIPYSKYNKSLSPDQDIQIYAAAKAEWTKRNQVKASLIESLIEEWIVANPKEYSLIINRTKSN